MIKKQDRKQVLRNAHLLSAYYFTHTQCNKANKRNIIDTILSEIVIVFQCLLSFLSYLKQRFSLYCVWEMFVAQVIIW